jgi:hypothetical protein
LTGSIKLIVSSVDRAVRAKKSISAVRALQVVARLAGLVVNLYRAPSYNWDMLAYIAAAYHRGDRLHSPTVTMPLQLRNGEAL